MFVTDTWLEVLVSCLTVGFGKLCCVALFLTDAGLKLQHVLRLRQGVGSSVYVFVCLCV